MKVNRTRQCATVEHYQEDWFEGSLEEIRDKLKEVERKYGKDAYIAYNWTGYEDCECCVYEYIHETDEQMQKRIASEEKALERQKAKKLLEAERAKERKRQKALAKKAKLEKELAELSKQL